MQSTHSSAGLQSRASLSIPAQQNYSASASPVNVDCGILPWLPSDLGLGTPREVRNSGIPISFDNILNIPKQQQSPFDHGKPLERFMASDDAPLAFIQPGSKLGQGHPTRQTPSEPLWSQLGETESMASGYSSGYGGSYAHSAGAEPSSWQGSQGKSAFLPSRPSIGHSPPYSDSYSPTGSRWSMVSNYVKPAEVNIFSAGASDRGSDEDENFASPTQTYLSPGYERQPLQPMEVQSAATTRYFTNTPRLPVPHPSSESMRNHTTKTHRHAPYSGRAAPASTSPTSRTPRAHVTTSSRLPRQSSAASHQLRLFVCTFHFAGCMLTFATKNEWKRHVSSQHLQSQIWRCDFQKCADRKAATFNRKDLFGQHLKRMHAPEVPEYTKAKNNGKSQNSKEMQNFLSTQIPVIQQRCAMTIRVPPESSRCGFCGLVFHGRGSWDERMEHVGRHYENAMAGRGSVEPGNWRHDQELIDWSVREGLVKQKNGIYTLGNVGKDAVVSLTRPSH